MNSHRRSIDVVFYGLIAFSLGLATGGVADQWRYANFAYQLLFVGSLTLGMGLALTVGRHLVSAKGLVTMNNDCGPEAANKKSEPNS